MRTGIKRRLDRMGRALEGRLTPEERDRLDELLAKVGGPEDPVIDTLTWEELRETWELFEKAAVYAD